MIDHIKSVITSVSSPPNPFFFDLESGTWSLSDFTETQSQFFWAVRHFHKPMKVLADRIPLNRNRGAIEENIKEELGLGESRMSHEKSFLLFLERLNQLSEQEVRSRPIWPELNQFNSTLDTVCGTWDYREAAVYMGVIELMFSDYSGRIGQGIVQAGWMKEEDLVHYTLHKGSDVQHAHDFFLVAESDWKHCRTALESAIQKSALAFDHLFRGLHENRSTRVR